MHPNLVLFDHPLIQHKLAILRSRDTNHRRFRDLMTQIAALMVYEVTRSFKTVPVDVQTPLETTVCRRIDSTITLVPVLRAGLGMTDGILDIMPEARVGHLGLARDEQTLQPNVYLKKLPHDLDAGPVILVDPMLATGGSALRAVSILREEGATDLRMICLVASPEGVKRMTEAEPTLTIYAAALDRQLDENSYIRPGLGDAGDRLFGTTEPVG